MRAAFAFVCPAARAAASHRVKQNVYIWCSGEWKAIFAANNFPKWKFLWRKSSVSRALCARARYLFTRIKSFSHTMLVACFAHGMYVSLFLWEKLANIYFRNSRIYDLHYCQSTRVLFLLPSLSRRMYTFTYMCTYVVQHSGNFGRRLQLECISLELVYVSPLPLCVFFFFK